MLSIFKMCQICYAHCQFQYQLSCFASYCLLLFRDYVNKLLAFIHSRLWSLLMAALENSLWAEGCPLCFLNALHKGWFLGLL